MKMSSDGFWVGTLIKLIQLHSPQRGMLPSFIHPWCFTVTVFIARGSAHMLPGILWGLQRTAAQLGLKGRFVLNLGEEFADIIRKVSHWRVHHKERLRRRTERTVIYADSCPSLVYASGTGVLRHSSTLTQCLASHTVAFAKRKTKPPKAPTPTPHSVSLNEAPVWTLRFFSVGNTDIYREMDERGNTLHLLLGSELQVLICVSTSSQ